MTDHRSLTDDVSRTARDAAYVAVGLGVLGVQRAQVRRRELMGRLGRASGDFHGRVGELQGRLGSIHGRLGDLAGASTALQQQLERFGDALGDLPAEARTALVELDGTLDAMITKLETAVEPLEEKLPVPARDVVRQARSQVSDARRQVHRRIRQLAS